MTIDDLGSGCCPVWDSNKTVLSTELFRVMNDGFPVAKDHMLIVPKRHLVHISQMAAPEWNQLSKIIRQLSLKYNDFNFGVNQGQYAGQTVLHLHFHFIPRRKGDVKDPRGGIRNLMPHERKPWDAG